MVQPCEFPQAAFFQDTQPLKQWLLILQIDIETAVETLRQKGYHICSTHFDPVDFTQERRVCEETQCMHLKKTAIPKAAQAVGGVEVTYQN